MNANNLAFQRSHTVPSVFITKSKKRLKQYENHVYLNGGDEFEIELYNPLTTKVLAKIQINGKYFSSGIILRPGERVFLERYLDDNQKFLFDVYAVDSNDEQTMTAIKNNGKVDVEFYLEKDYSYTTYPNIWYNTGTAYNTINPPTYTISGSPGTRSSLGDTGHSGHSGPSGTMGTAGPTGHAGLSSSMCIDAIATCSTNTYDIKCSMVETGRVERGSKSNQSFITDYNTTFNSYYSYAQSWILLPESNRPKVISDFKIYCTNCGAKRKKTNHNFCPHCGSKF